MRSKILKPLKKISVVTDKEKEWSGEELMSRFFWCWVLYFNILKCSPYKHNICPGNTQMESFTMHPEARNRQLNPVSFVEPLLSLPHCYHEDWKIQGLSKSEVFTRSPCSDRLLAGCLYHQVLYLTTHLVLKLLHKIGDMYPYFDRWRYSLNSQCL